MKIKLLTVYSALIALAMITLSLGSGCASTASSGNGSYQLKQTRTDIDWAMVRYHNRVAFGFLTPAEQQQVTAAYKNYQTAFNTAVQQAHSDYNSPTPNNVKILADQLVTVLDSIP